MAASILILSLKERTAQKMKFSIKDFFSKCFPQETADLVTFTEEILNGKLYFFRAIEEDSLNSKQRTSVPFK